MWSAMTGQSWKDPGRARGSFTGWRGYLRQYCLPRDSQGLNPAMFSFPDKAPAFNCPGDY